MVKCAECKKEKAIAKCSQCGKPYCEECAVDRDGVCCVETIEPMTHKTEFAKENTK